jgi:glutamine cyclotransferase
MLSLLSLILPIMAAADGPTGQSMSQEIEWYGYEIVNRYPHDPAAFTQGLVWHDGHLWEGTGTEGASTVRKVTLETGEVVRKVDLEADVFGEGIAIWKDSIIQLTWQQGIAFVRNIADLRERKRFHYSGEGWGLTSDGSRLIMSNGSSTLTYRDPETFRLVGSVDVAFRGRQLRALNELEFIDGRIWANVLMTNQIVMIDPDTGQVTGVLPDGNPLARGPGRHDGRRSERNRLGSREEPDLRHREVLAEALRDQTRRQVGLLLPR